MDAKRVEIPQIEDAGHLRSIGQLTELGQHAVHSAIWPYSTALLVDDDDGAPPRVLGSGTLVRIRGAGCLLTAAHVAEQVLESTALSMTTILDRAPVRVPVQTLTPIAMTPRTNGEWGEWGPDIALLRLHEHDVRRLEVEKAFYAIDRPEGRPREIVETPGSRVAWALCGAPAETARILPDVGVLNIKTLVNDAVTRHTREDGLDYIDSGFGRTDPSNIPTSWGGVSGAGLWACVLAPGDDRTQMEVSPLLVGVVFYAVPAGPKHGVIRAHGPHSLQRLVFDPALFGERGDA